MARLEAGSLLPASRVLAAEFGTGRNSVLRVYENAGASRRRRLVAGRQQVINGCLAGEAVSQLA